MYVRPPRMLNINKREEQQVESSFSFVHFDNTLPLGPERGQLHEKSRESSRTQPLEPKILKVKPLNAAEDGDDSERQKSTGTNKGVMVNQRLDWNKLFTFLSHTIDAADSKLFFIHLFSNGEHLLPYGQTVNNKIEHISSNTKGSTPTLLFNQFEAWKSLMGDKADPKQIEKALQDRGNNEALRKFQHFMRCPPMTPVQLVQRNKMSDVLGKQCQLVLHKPNSFNKALEYTP
ncbi:uncharacterized protein LOC128555466 [Mercenaria mercenaria]|uniref:uncharacterized protein LOC128555466 n=1 Tax=Mercenaria mercenaria TaxID=6596 RepID=UPI00234E4BF7|nr:uncharacterized protein LOC128555466 [Mercenaria mercenaria]